MCFSAILNASTFFLNIYIFPAISDDKYKLILEYMNNLNFSTVNIYYTSVISTPLTSWSVTSLIEKCLQ